MAEYNEEKKVVRIRKVKTFKIQDYKIANYFLLPLERSEIEDMVMRNLGVQKK